MLKRSLDILFSLIGLIVLFPLFIVIALAIVLDSKGGFLYRQLRVGQGGNDFYLYKFRSMYEGADQKGLLTVGGNDSRITKTGYFLRKSKLDELPQLFNVLIGDMSLVGPRPEVRKYVDMYTNEQLQVLSVKPGITDYASIKYFNENELLGNSENSEKTYVEEIMPEKLQLNLEYIKYRNLWIDIEIIFKTMLKIFR